ncbi:MULTISPECIES: DUF2334 domain-containing protein [Bacteroides]|uniref:DUF2334 domain-containing protein n=3 Tax=Bacteroides fragilis TaxID=817 RepID=A0ABD4VRT7_BACFG|nr:MULTISPECIES: DUF2334 domain-containing protein [Bacteroides]MCE8566691.1 DUF2334 domain-containing protein [Bacteroides fragilis]MCM0195720.1 DUF2334 domain-containing protein [Bacteroides fragilis]MCM0199498.1 DUF2334 domain-containing protein [Bacteroides fragilis]MCM0210898.1 DUF2334 domain-containing protein [Bacteroides fragilis]MCM0214357.1 DUF2334 domain-containing protein [Bacteroides fragilis]
MRVHYLIRLDDACPTMDKNKWERIEFILDQYKICPMVGVIPFNQDISLERNETDYNFWDKVKDWQNKGWKIALHGYNHIYCSKNSGINPVHKRSEFAGLPLDIQKKKIVDGENILLMKGIRPTYFFAPSHTFDDNTLAALKEGSKIRMISDTPAFSPYREKGFIFIPQQFGTFRDVMIPGYWTFCFHPNSMCDNEFVEFEKFIEKHNVRFISFGDIDITKLGSRTIWDKCYASLYYLYRKIKA